MSSRKRIGGLLLLGALVGLASGIWLLRDFFGAAPAAGASAIDLLIERDDIYTVSRADLRRLGWGDVSPEDLRLETAGEPYPFFLREEGGDFWIVFYGRAPGDPDRRYTPQNVYRLFRDADVERTRRFAFLAESANEVAGVRSQVRAAVVLEENGFYVPALEEGRPWFWQQLAAPGVITIPFDLEEPVDGEAVITTALAASTEAESADPDHHLIFTLNGTPVADETWDGAGPRTIEIRVAAETLRSEGNVLEIRAPGDTGIPAEIVLLDWVQVEYSRTAALDGGTLHFSAVGDQTGFSGIGSGPIVLFELLPGDGAPSLAWIEQTGGSVLPTVPGRAYAAGALADLPGPAGLRALPEGTDLRSHPGAAYLAIGAPDLLEPLEPLLEHREAGGLSTLAVPLETVYDQFGAGIRTPEAIRQFLVYAVENWEAVPQYVLLVGDWTYDPFGFTSKVPDYGLPSFFVFTEYGGETVSDVEFAKLDEDALPDLALGRIPARTPEQVGIVVDKTLAYETGAGGAWTRRVLAVADGSERRFTADAAAFLAGFDADYEPVLVEQTGAGGEVAAEVDRELSEGALIFSYFGHGSLTQFGKDDLFDTEHAEALANGDRTPIMVSITCLAGLFTHPAVDSLTEAMLWNESGGAVAGLSATSLTLPQYQAYLGAAFVEHLVAASGERLGSVLLFAQRDMPVSIGSGAVEVLDTFLLFGDPGVLLP